MAKAVERANAEGELDAAQDLSVVERKVVEKEKGRKEKEKEEKERKAKARRARARPHGRKVARIWMSTKSVSSVSIASSGDT